MDCIEARILGVGIIGENLILNYKNINNLKNFKDEYMHLAKVSANGQVTIPVEIRRKLQVKSGYKILFIEQDGEIVIRNASSTAIVRTSDTAGETPQNSFGR